jgi:dTDP-4-amino-4,6-dideoxygalactose transaminase
MALNGMTYSNNNWERKIKYPGYKMYMNSIQAEIGLNNFKLYDSKIARLGEIREMYNKSLGYYNTSNHLYRINDNLRDGLRCHLGINNISSGIHYEAFHNNPVYKIENVNCPKSDLASKTTLSIPFHEKLSDLEVNHIIDKIKVYND